MMHSICNGWEFTKEGVTDERCVKTLNGMALSVDYNVSDGAAVCSKGKRSPGLACGKLNVLSQSDGSRIVGNVGIHSSG